MIAGVLVSLVILFTLALVPSFKVSSRRANMELQASSLAQSGLEQARSIPFAELTNETQTVNRDQMEYRQSRQVTVSSSGLVKTIRVEVDWTWKDKEFQVFRETKVCRVPRG